MFATALLVLPVFALILTGWGAGRAGILPAPAVDLLNAYVTRLALPVLLFHFVAGADWAELWQPRFVAALGGGIAILFTLTVLLMPRRHGMTGRSVAALAAAYANTAFLGIPIGGALFGAPGIAGAVIASLLTVCAIFAIGLLLVEVDRHREHGIVAAVPRVLRAVLANPLVAGPLAGALWALTGLALPGPVDQFATLLGNTAPPVALVTIGLFLANMPGGDGAPARIVWPLVAAKLLLHPLLTACLVWALAVPQPWAAIAILIAALPTGTGPFMLAKLYDEGAGVAARTVLLTTLIASLTVPLLASLLL